MKALFSTVILWAGLFMSLLSGQDLVDRQLHYTSKLNVYQQNEIVAIVSCRDLHKLNKGVEWKNLLNSFKENLGSVKDEIPEYLIYKIDYEKDYNLIIEEVEGIVRYRVDNGQTNFKPGQSIAMLRAEDFIIQLNFGKLDDLLSDNYMSMIESAMSKIGEKQGLIMRTYFPKNKFHYSFSKNEMMKIKHKTKVKLVVPLTGTVGFFKGSPIYESSFGIGFSLQKENKEDYNLFYAYSSLLFQYNKELAKSEGEALWGLAWQTKAVTFGLGFPSSKEGFFRDVDMRFSTTVRARNNLAVTLHTYITESNLLPSISVGFAF